MSTPITSPGILLRTFPYSESSKVFRFLTPQHGLLSVIGKGVRSKNYRAEAPLETFAEGALTFSFRPQRDLHTLQDFRQGEGSMALGRDVQRFVGASLWAELLLSHALEGGDEELYQWVSSSLQGLIRVSVEDVPGQVLAGAWRVLALLGFSPDFDACVGCGAELDEVVHLTSLAKFDVVAGGVRCSQCAGVGGGPKIGPGALEQLRGLVMGEYASPFLGVRAHLALLEAFCTYHLGLGAEFRSFAILRSLWRERVEESPISLDHTEGRS